MRDVCGKAAGQATAVAGLWVMASLLGAVHSCQPGQLGSGQSYIANLRLFHAERFGVNLTWDYVAGGRGDALATSDRSNVLFTVQFYQLAVNPCCGPYPVLHCNEIVDRWCHVSGLESSDGYHFQVLASEGSCRSNVSSVGFFLNGNNAPAGCPLEESVYPQPGCSLEAHFRLGDGYTSLVTSGNVKVLIQYASTPGLTSMLMVNSTLANIAFLNYTMALPHTQCNTSYTGQWEAVTDVGGVQRTTGPCFHFAVHTDQSKVPLAPFLYVLAANTTATSLAVRWSAIRPLYASVAETAYVLCFSELVNSSVAAARAASRSVCGSAIGSPSCSELRGSGHHQFKRPGLHPGTVYAVNVTALNRYGTGESSNTEIAATSDTVPSWPDTNINCTQTSTSSVLLTWTEPVWNTVLSNRMNIVVSVDVWQRNVVGGLAGRQFPLPWTSTSLAVQDLVPGALYHVIVVAWPASSSAQRAIGGQCELDPSFGTPRAGVPTMPTLGAVSGSTRTVTGHATAPTEQSSGGLGTQWIVLIASGCVLAVAALVALCVWCWSKTNKLNPLKELRRRGTLRQADLQDDIQEENDYVVEPRRLPQSSSNTSQHSIETVVSIVSLSPDADQMQVTVTPFNPVQDGGHEQADPSLYGTAV